MKYIDLCARWFMVAVMATCWLIAVIRYLFFVSPLG